MSFKFNNRPTATTTTAVSFKVQPSPTDSPFFQTNYNQHSTDENTNNIRLMTDDANNPAEDLFLFSPSPRILKKHRPSIKSLSISLPPIRKSVGFGPSEIKSRKTSEEDGAISNPQREEQATNLGRTQYSRFKRNNQSLFDSNSLLKMNESYLNDVYHGNKQIFLRKNGKNPEIFKKQQQNESIFIQFNKKKLLIQPKFMEEKGSMCLTELWGDKLKKILIHANEFNKIMDANSLRTVPVNKEYISVFNKYKIENEINMYNKLLDLKGGMKVSKPGVQDLIDGLFKNEMKSKNSRFAQRRFSEFYSSYGNGTLINNDSPLGKSKRETLKKAFNPVNKRDALKKLNSQVLVTEAQSGFYNNFSDLLMENERENSKKYIKSTFVELENLKQHIQVVLDGNTELEKEINTKQKEVKKNLSKLGKFKIN